MKKIMLHVRRGNEGDRDKEILMPDGYEKFFSENNLPATHFIQVYNHRLAGITQALCVEIAYMPSFLEFTEGCKHKTIAIFKIRAK